MGKSKRHHFIPQYLLKCFASRIRKKNKGSTVHVWLHGVGSKAREVSTKDVAVVKNFHGAAEHGLEERFSNLENAQAGLTQRIPTLSEAALTRESDALVLLVHCLSVRTRTLRDEWGKATGELLAAAGEEFTSDLGVQSLMSQMTDEYMEEQLREYMVEHGLDRDPGAVQVIQEKVDSGELFDLLRIQIPPEKIKKDVAHLFGYLESNFDTKMLAKDAHNKALEVIIAAGFESPFVDVGWSIIHCPKGNQILGDNPVVFVDRGGDVGPFGKFRVGELDAMYLPLGPSVVLCGRCNPRHAYLTQKEIREACAKTASSFFVASCNSEENQELVGLVGEKALSFDLDASGIVRDALRRGDSLDGPKQE